MSKTRQCLEANPGIPAVRAPASGRTHRKALSVGRLRLARFRSSASTSDTRLIQRVRIGGRLRLFRHRQPPYLKAFDAFDHLRALALPGCQDSLLGIGVFSTLAGTVPRKLQHVTMDQGGQFSQPSLHTVLSDHFRVSSLRLTAPLWLGCSAKIQMSRIRLGRSPGVQHLDHCLGHGRPMETGETPEALSSCPLVRVCR